MSGAVRRYFPTFARLPELCLLHQRGGVFGGGVEASATPVHVVDSKLFKTSGTQLSTFSATGVIMLDCVPIPFLH
jgi:hypothetical protein